MTEEPETLIPHLPAVSVAAQVIAGMPHVTNWTAALRSDRYAEFEQELAELAPLVQLLLTNLAPHAPLQPLTGYPPELLEQRLTETRERNPNLSEAQLTGMVQVRLDFETLYRFYVAMKNLRLALHSDWAHCLLLPEADQRVLHGQLQLVKSASAFVLAQVAKMRIQREVDLAALPA